MELDNKTFINNEFQNIIFKIKSSANDMNQNKDKNIIYSQLQNILYSLTNLNKVVIEELNKSNNEAEPSLIQNENKIMNIMIEDGKYIGEIKNGIPNGRGKLFYTGNLEGDIYEGEFKDGEPDGKGKYCHRNGNIYVGDFIKDKADGKGIFYCNNGDRYEGDFKKDAREGKGIFYFANGDRMMGDFHNNNPIGKHVILQKNGNVVQKIFD